MVTSSPRTLRVPIHPPTGGALFGWRVARQESKWIPREFLENPTEFGMIDSPAHRAPVDEFDAAQLAMALAQHRAARVIRARRERGLTVRALAEWTGDDEGYLSGKLRGVYPVDYVELALWAQAIGDISVLPVYDSLDEFEARTKPRL